MKRQGKVLWAHVATSKDQADKDVDDYKDDSRNRGQWSIRVHPRTVRANSVEIPVWVVIVREKAAEDNLEPTPEERAALELYASTHGRNWKRQLLDDWTNGRTVGELQVIRNSRGPSWLIQHFHLRPSAGELEP